jgi:protein TonB
MYVLQCEPESRSRWRLLTAGGALGSVVFGVTLSWAAQMKPEPRPVENHILQMRVVQTHKPELPKELPMERPAPEPPPKKQLQPKPTQTPATPPPKEATPAAPPPPLAIGLTLSSTTQGGRGPRFAVGDTLMGEPDRVAQAPRPPRAAVDTTREAPAAPAAPRASVKQDRVTSAAKLERSVTPVYPSSAKSQGLEGVVILAITIGPNGQVERAQVLKSLGSGLDESALSAARQTRWSPATLDGQPIRSTRRFNVRFTLSG